MLRQKLAKLFRKLPEPVVVLVVFLPFILIVLAVNGTFFVFLPSNQWFWLGHISLLLWIASSFAWNYLRALRRTVHMVPLAALLRKFVLRVILVPFLFSPLFVYGAGLAATISLGSFYEEKGSIIYKKDFQQDFRGRSLNFSCAGYKMDRKKLHNIYFLQGFCISADAYNQIPNTGGFIELNGKRSWFGRAVIDYKIIGAS